MADSNDLLLYIPFSDSGAPERFPDNSGNGFDARCGGAVPCPQRRGGAGFFRLSASHWEWLEVAHRPELNPGRELTMSVWIFPANALWQGNRPVKIGGGKVVGKTTARFNGGYLLGTDVKSQERLTYSLYPEIWDSAGKQHVFRAGEFGFQEWTHLAVTWKSGGRMKGYVNGEEVASIAASNRPIGSNTNPLRIAIAPWDTNALAFGGGVDELRIYARELSGGEVRSLYNAGREEGGGNVEPGEGDGDDEDGPMPPAPF